MSQIETGVDKLVKLVEQEKKIELKEAAKRLGVHPTVVQEWAEFLEEEGLVSLDFSLSKTYLVEKRLSRAEVTTKEKEYGNKKEAFIRRVDVALKQIDNESVGFETIRDQYNAVKDKIGDEIEQVKDELDQLRHYEELKKSIDGDVMKQKVQYQKTIDEIHSRISCEQRRYEKILVEVEGEEKKIVNEQTEFTDLKKEEHDLLKRIDALHELITRAHGRIQAREDALEIHEDRLETLRELAEKLRDDLVDKRKKEIEPLLKVSDDQSKKIMRIQDDIVEKVKAGREHMHEFDTESREITEHFAKFFEKRSRTEETMRELETAKREMKEQLNELIRKAKAFEIGKKSADTNRHIKELDSKFKEFDRRKNAFGRQMDFLKRLISGKEDPSPPVEKNVEKKPAASVKKAPIKKKVKKKAKKTRSKSKKK